MSVTLKSLTFLVFGLSKPVNRESKAAKRTSSDRPHGTTLDTVEECYRALGRAVELSEELALGTDVVVAAYPKSPRSKVCKVQPDAWLINTGSGHDLVDFALVLDSAQLIEPASSNILLHTANGECRPNGSIVMDIKPLNETSSALVLENTPTPSPPTKSLDFRGFDSSRLSILRGGNSHIR